MEIAIPFQDRDACLIWPYSKKKKEGYGNIVIGGKYCIVSRVVCEKVHGQPNPGDEAAHSCGNTSCCNPWHVSWKTRTQNEHDKVAHGTATRGERGPSARLTEADVREIRRCRYTETRTSLARRFNVDPSHVGHIQHGRVWKYI